MRAALHGEILRMLSTRLPLWTLLAALVCGEIGRASCRERV